jgi:mannose-6-phosphate isomerase-like protein (cupin superfamily)
MTMIVRRNEMKVEKKDNLRGGQGTITFTHYLEPDTQKYARMLAEMSLPPGASLGYHQHENEAEYYIVHSGSGIVNNNGEETPIRSGDVMVTADGAFHSIKNTGTEPLVLSAIIVTH